MAQNFKHITKPPFLFSIVIAKYTQAQETIHRTVINSALVRQNLNFTALIGESGYQWRTGSAVSVVEFLETNGERCKPFIQAFACIHTKFFPLASVIPFSCSLLGALLTLGRWPLAYWARWKKTIKILICAAVPGAIFIHCIRMRECLKWPN